MADIALRFERDVVVVDGAMGSLLIAEGIEPDMHSMLLNALEPELIEAVHKRYIQAGAQAITSNSFGGSRPRLAAHRLEERLEELNRLAVRIAKSCRPQHVLADVGPCGLSMAPLGRASFDQVFEVYAEQVRALAAEEPDAILIETMTSIADARCAVMAAKSACDLPVIASVSFGPAGVMELSGTDAAAAAVILQSAGADVVGINCALGPAELLPLIASMAEACDLPLIARPNAGLPTVDSDGNAVYPLTPDQMAEAAWALRQLGVQLIGSCCGTTPSHTAAIYVAVGGGDSLRRAGAEAAAARPLRLASPTSTVAVEKDGPCLTIGERINPTNKPQLTASLREGDISLAVSLAIGQDEAGADLIDVNVGGKGIDSKKLLPELALELAAVVRAPLVFDTLNAKSLEAALRVYPGRALINSVNGSQTSLETVLPLAKRYGAAVIALCTEGWDMPDGIDGLLEIAGRIQAAARATGLADEDLLFDAVAMAKVLDENAGEKAIDAVRALSEQGYLTALAISNVSYKQENRSAMHVELLQAAIEAGLNVAILDPIDEDVMLALAEANQRRAQQQEPVVLSADA